MCQKCWRSDALTSISSYDFPTKNVTRTHEALAAETELWQVKYLNNGVEQDYRNIKRITKPMTGFKSFNNARITLSGIEAMNLLRKGQVKEVEQGSSVSQAKFIEAIFGIAA